MKPILNKQGYIGFGGAFLVFIVTFAFLFVLYNSSSNSLKISKETSRLTDHYVAAANGKERLHGALYENFSLVGEVEYEDILKSKYVIETISEDFSNKILNSNGEPISFELKNKSEINISVSTEPFTLESICTYSVSLLNENGREMLQGEGLNHFDKTFNIPSQLLYNEQTGETNLGLFNFSINSSGCSTSTQISYNELLEREVSVKGNSIDLNILIEGLPNEKITIKGGN